MAAIATIWLLLFCGIVSPLLAQDWAAARAIPADTPVRVFTSGGRLDGRLSLIDDRQIRIVSDGKLVEVTRPDVVRLEQKRRDPLWNGLLFGALTSLALRAAFGGEACSRTPEPRCTARGVAVGAALGTFVDLQITGYRLVYTAPRGP
jgi:hypothetical protein